MVYTSHLWQIWGWFTIVIISLYIIIYIYMCMMINSYQVWFLTMVTNQCGKPCAIYIEWGWLIQPINMVILGIYEI